MRKRIGQIIRVLKGGTRDDSGVFLRHHQTDGDDLEDGFIYRTSVGALDVSNTYRSRIKEWWRYFGPYSALAELDKLNLLDIKSAQFLHQSTNGRTLTASLEEARAVLAPYISRHRDMFISETVPDLEKRPTKPSRADVEKETLRHVRNHRKSLEILIARRLLQPNGSLRVLEIGYTSGGTSALAWERAGCEAHGIDYFFGGTVEKGARHRHIAELMQSKVHFHVGDITGQTELPSDYFDIVYSSSVIEHLSDLELAFIEINRLLKPGGVSLHSYDPFFHPAGGHSLGTLDSAWGHVRLSKQELLEYIRVLRPHEAVAAIPWVSSALFPEHNQSRVQMAIAAAGLLLREWKTSWVDDAVASRLTDEIVRDALRVHPGISVSDLLAKRVSFIAQKEF